jgi:dCMP deaminase
MRRLTQDEYGMFVAWAARARSTCPRMACGAIVTDERGNILSTGYNGAPSGMPHCTEVGCRMEIVRERKRCVRIKHAEANAIRKAGGQGHTLYTTGKCCYDCLQDVLSSSIQRVVWAYEYEDTLRDETLAYLAAAGRLLIEDPARPLTGGLIPRGIIATCWLDLDRVLEEMISREHKDVAPR